MNPELDVFEPWMAIVGLGVLCVAIVHKRFFFRAVGGSSPLRQFLVPAFVHFLPAAIALFVVVAVSLRLFAEAGRPVSGVVAQAVTLFGIFLLAELLLHAELLGLRSEKPKW